MWSPLKTSVALCAVLLVSLLTAAPLPALAATQNNNPQCPPQQCPQCPQWDFNMCKPVMDRARDEKRALMAHEFKLNAAMPPMQSPIMSSAAPTQPALTDDQKRAHRAQAEKNIQGAIKQQVKEAHAALSARATNKKKTKKAAPAAPVEYTCSWQFTHYEPSAWEKSWQSNEQRVPSICARLQQEIEHGVYSVARSMELQRLTKPVMGSESKLPNPGPLPVENADGEYVSDDETTVATGGTGVNKPAAGWFDQLLSPFLSRPSTKKGTKHPVRSFRVNAGDEPLFFPSPVGPSPGTAAAMDLNSLEWTGEVDAAGQDELAAPKRQSQSHRRRLLRTSPEEEKAAEELAAREKDLDHMRREGDKLMSRMHYALKCRLGSSTDENAFVAATGFDLIEPLIGMLRDPLTICNIQVPPHLSKFVDNSYDKVQSKASFVLQVGTPFNISVQPAGVEGLPAWYTPHMAKQLEVALRAVAGTSGIAPWLHSTSHPLPLELPPEAPLSAEAIAAAKQLKYELREDAFLGRVTVKPGDTVESFKENPRYSQAARSEEEEHTAILLSSNGMVSVPASLSVNAPAWNPLSTRRSRAGPRTLVFDFGASLFAGWNDEVAALGSAWIYTQLKGRGLRVDRVYGWEYEVLDPVIEWTQIPADLYPEFTFINTGVSADPTSMTNPWNTLLAVARPIDHVIVKLDIDSPHIEVPLMQQLLASPALQGLVDEMFFEHHVDIPEMHRYWGGGLPQRVQDSYNWYSALRRSGVRMHSWP